MGTQIGIDSSMAELAMYGLRSFFSPFVEGLQAYPVVSVYIVLVFVFLTGVRVMEHKKIKGV